MKRRIVITGRAYDITSERVPASLTIEPLNTDDNGICLTVFGVNDHQLHEVHINGVDARQVALAIQDLTKTQRVN